MGLLKNIAKSVLPDEVGDFVDSIDESIGKVKDAVEGASKENVTKTAAASRGHSRCSRFRKALSRKTKRMKLLKQKIQILLMQMSHRMKILINLQMVSKAIKSLIFLQSENLNSSSMPCLMANKKDLIMRFSLPVYCDTDWPMAILMYGVKE